MHQNCECVFSYTTLCSELHHKTQHSEHISEGCPEMTERIKHAFDKHQPVCVCVCVSSYNCTVSLCPSPTPRAPSQRRENKGTSLCLIYLYPRILPISPGVFISLRQTIKTIVSQRPCSPAHNQVFSPPLPDGFPQ